MKLDKSKPYGMVYGGAAVYEQHGLPFDGAGNLIKQEAPLMPPAPSKKDMIIPHDKVESAKIFIINILKTGPLSKSVVYKVASDNNQVWEDVKAAAELIGVVMYQYQKAQMWKLPETMQET
jgi:hypothetical protein